MKSVAETNVKSGSFWLRHPDPTQAAVHLALQWLAHVYPASELHVEETLRQALPYADEELNRRWRQFLEQKDVEDHVQALRWLSKTVPREQIPFLVESCWRLLLVSHDMPNQVPLALRLLGRILDVPEYEILEIGQQVQREVDQQGAQGERAPLLPEDPRYLDRVEWRLYGESHASRPTPEDPRRKSAGWIWRYLSVFTLGGVFGAMAVSYLVWGPMQLGRQPVPRMSHLVMAQDPESTAPLISLPTAKETPTPVSEPGSREVAPEVLVTDTEVVLSIPEASDQPPEPVSEPTAPEAGSDGGAETASQADSAAADLDPAEPQAQQTDAVERREALMTVTASVLNVRAEPTIDSAVVMKLGDGARVWVDPARSVGDWRHIRVGDVQGYASGRYMEPAN